MSKREQQYKKRQRMNALFEEISTSFNETALTVDANHPAYKFLMTHPHNADRVDDVVVSECHGFLGFKNK